MRYSFTLERGNMFRMGSISRSVIIGHIVDKTKDLQCTVLRTVMFLVNNLVNF